MSNLLRIATILACAMAITVSAAEGKEKKKGMSEEQKAVMKEMVGKYDKNGDKKLDKDERAAMSAEDKAKMDKTFPRTPKKKKSE